MGVRAAIAKVSGADEDGKMLPKHIMTHTSHRRPAKLSLFVFVSYLYKSNFFQFYNVLDQIEAHLCPPAL